ncbi:MAG: hypothetical protein JSV91_14250 [Phycisphaerales bacterium]|nr:MAG: hypothetical protein JSV91_14250 [Phycisphaerales bacterium]
MRLTPKTKVRRTALIERPWKITLGELTVVGDQAALRGQATITVGDRCVISQLAILTTCCRNPSRAGFPLESGPITIRDDCWVAADTLVMPGVTIEEGTVVGARALVENNLPGWTVAAGQPATPRKQRVMNPS